jgi:hypothetical protein
MAATDLPTASDWRELFDLRVQALWPLARRFAQRSARVSIQPLRDFATETLDMGTQFGLRNWRDRTPEQPSGWRKEYSGGHFTWGRFGEHEHDKLTVAARSLVEAMAALSLADTEWEMRDAAHEIYKHCRDYLVRRGLLSSAAAAEEAEREHRPAYGRTARRKETPVPTGVPHEPGRLMWELLEGQALKFTRLLELLKHEARARGNQFSVSRPTLFRWLAKFKESGTVEHADNLGYYRPDAPPPNWEPPKERSRRKSVRRK